MKKLIYLLLALPLLATSCSTGDIAADEAVEVCFSAELPRIMGTRATPTSVDKVYCAVFENGEEILNFREEIDITSGSIVYAPRLIKGKTYDIVFWASKAGAYDVSDLTAIKRNAAVAEADFDAFTARTNITVVGNFRHVKNKFVSVSSM